MNRAFISLYFFIVISVVMIGWGLDKFWETLSPPSETPAEVVDLLALLDVQLKDLPPDQQAQWLTQIDAGLQHKLRIIALDDIATSSTGAQILAGEIVAVGTSDSSTSWYKRLAQSEQVLVLSAPTTDSNYSTIYSGLLVVFYLGIAVVIFLWIWPLSRDLSKLEKQTRHIGKDGVTQSLAIPPTSTVYPLANAFNKMAQRIRELLSSHKEMTYAVSHELRTPLARMKFALAMTETSNATDAQKKSLQSIGQDIAEMEELITSLLLYAGFEQSSGQLDRREGHMKDLLDEMLARLYRDRASTVAIEIIDHTPGAIYSCEWKLMETVIQNLLLNAVRFARSRVRIELAALENIFQISVEDDGPGIPKEERTRVFDSFVRLYNEDSKQAGGFGLGLAIVRRVMQWHGGKVEFADSNLDGAKAVLSWPKRNN